MLSLPPPSNKCRLQALKLQTMNCAYHNTLEQKLELSKDHSCGTRMIPQVSIGMVGITNSLAFLLILLQFERCDIRKWT